MAEEKDTAAPAKRTAGKTGRRKKPEAEHAARAAPQDKDTGSKAQEILEQARTEPKPEWEVAEQVVLLPLDRLRPFKNHPFKVNDEDELMQDTIDSIMAGGVINPILVRPAEDGRFEVVSGHRRFRASELAGKADIKAIVREMDDDTAVITMVDSNLQRENILPSERAFSYRMKMEALTHQGQRTDPTLRQVGAKFRTAELVGQPAGDSARQVQRFIRLTELIPQLLDMVDRKELAFNPAVELSYLKPHEQEQFLDAMDYAQATPSLSQAQRLSRSVADIEIIHAALRYGAPRGEPRRICTAVKSVWQNQKHYCSGKGSFLQKKAGNRGSVPLRGEFWFELFCALLTEY